MSRALAFACAFLLCLSEVAAQDQLKKSCSEIEQFLLTAKIGPGKETRKGVTHPMEVMLDDGKIQHVAVVQNINERKAQFQSMVSSELNFRDFWGFNVAGWEVAKRLEIGIVPPYVARRVRGKESSVSWLIPDVMMDEVDRTSKKIGPPDPDTWNKEMYLLRVFNELVYNTDNNLTNVLITKDWHLWLIDFTRAFRLHKTLREPKNLVKCDRRLLANLRKLDRDELLAKLVNVRPQLLSKGELDAMMARRDKIVEFFDNEVKQKGESAVLFDLPRVGKSCGFGL